MASGMTFKKFATGAVELPATIFSWIVNLLLGYTETDSLGRPKLKDKKPIEHNGLLGLLMDVIKALGRGISTFIKEHKQAIASAFWFSLLVGGGLALALYLSPALLAAVANFSFQGFSIVGMVGADPLLQMGLAASLAAAATSLVTYVAAALINFTTGIKNCIYPPDEFSGLDADELEQTDENYNSGPKAMMTQLHVEKPVVAGHVADAAPEMHASPMAKKPAANKEPAPASEAVPAAAV